MQKLKNAKVRFYSATAILLLSFTFMLCSEDAEGYTSLYGDSDNQYEEIQTETKFEGLRSIKELLLRVRIVSRYKILRNYNI